MTTELGQQLANYQSDLARHWASHGPDGVYARVNSMTHDQLVTLVMANVGAQAVAI